MAQTITLEVPQDVYDSLVKQAEEVGQPPEKVAVDWLTATVHWRVSDPLANFIGALHSDIPDWADNHDYYIGQALLDTHDDESEPTTANG
jgi:hypothetical protein